MRKTKIISISLTQDLQDEINHLAKEERRTVSEIVRQAVKEYLAKFKDEEPKITKETFDF